MRLLRWLALAAGLAGVASVTGVGCRSPEAQVRGYRAKPPAAASEAPGSSGFPSARLAPSNTAAGRDLADRVMLASEGLLADVQIVDNKHLRVVLGSRAEPEVVPDLLRALVLVMHEAFPREDVTVQMRSRAGHVLVTASVHASEGTITYTIPRYSRI